MHLLKYLLIFSLLACSNMSTDSGKDVDLSENEINVDIEKVTLDNGLRILLIENHKLPIFSFYTFYKVGAVNETKGITGTTHFLEHMLFKGPVDKSLGKFDTLVESNGGSSNAYTTNDMTVYYENLPVSALDKIIKVEASRMEAVLLEPKAFEKERNVILEERKMRYENSPRGKLYLASMRAMFENTPYGRSVIGAIPDLKSVTPKQMGDYFKNYYAPNNAVVVIVGDFDSSEVASQMEEHFGRLKKNEKLATLKAEKEKPEFFQFKGKYNRTIRIHDAKSPTPTFSLKYQGVKLGVKDSFTMDILSSILGDGKSSHLHQKYVEGRKPLLRHVGVSNINMIHAGYFSVDGALMPGVSERRFFRNLKRDLRNSCTPKVISERNVQKVKNQYLVSVYNGLQTNAGIARFFGAYENYFGDYNFYKKELDIYQSITPAQVLDVCKKVFDDKKSIITAIWNKYKKTKKR